MDKAQILTDDDLRLNGIDALNQALGVTNALRFLSLLSHDKTDYIAMSRQLYENQTVEEVFERAKANWRG